jgi:hypothetical protein
MILLRKLNNFKFTKNYFIKLSRLKSLNYQNIYFKTNMEKTGSSTENIEIQTLFNDLNIKESNMPEIPKKEMRYQSFGGRIRVSALVDDSASQFIGKIITVGGWARSVRTADGGNIAFIELNDGSTIKNFQIVVNKNITGFEQILKEGIGTCFTFKGEVVKSPGDKQPVRNILIKKIRNI